MKSKKISFISFILIAIFLMSGCMTKKIKLSLNMKKGDSFKIDTVTEEKVTQNISGKKVEANAKYNMVYGCYVADVDKNKNMLFQVTLESLSVKNVGSQGTILENQTGNPTSNKNELNKIFSVLPGKTFKVKVSSDGKVKEVMGIEELVAKVLKELGVKDEKQKQEAQKMIVDEFGEETIQKQVENITSAYPDEEVKVGESWQNKSDVLLQYPLEAENTYTLQESKDDVADITFESKVKTKENEDPLILGPIKLSYDIKGKQTGLMNVDEKTGLPKHTKTDYKYDGHIKLESQDPNTGSKQYPITIEGNTIINIAGK